MEIQNDDSYLVGKVEAVRNPDGTWINSMAFRESGEHFMKHRYYVADPWGTPDWMTYWKRERDRTINGLTMGGVRITGEHYSYLNYSPIQKVGEIKGNKASKITGFPDFWDGDYNYFWIRKIARDGILDALLDEPGKELTIHMTDEEKALEMKKLFEELNLFVDIEVDFLNGGYNLIVGKSRRKGYSLKAAAIGSNNYFTKPNKLTIFGAHDKKYLYPNGIFGMAYENINFINEHTGWAMPSDVIDRLGSGHVRASYIQYKNGIKLEKGFKSEILALTFKDNPDAARGKDAEEVFFEESGAFGTPGLLKKAYKATEDCVMAGAIKTGLITIFGTSGDMSGGTYDYADMFGRPQAFGLLPFKNIWDEDSTDMSVGFFHPINWNMEGYYDENGNSDKEGAKNVELNIRKDLEKHGATSTELQQRMQEKPLGPGEAFASISVNNFPVLELKRQLQKCKAKGWQFTKGTPVNMYYKDGKIVAEPIMDGTAKPIISFHNVPTDKRGCPMIYEQPIANPSGGLYKIGYDPIRQDQGTSLASIVVYKSKHVGSYHHDIIVAEYIGRMETPSDIDRIAEMFADLYGTKIMYENEVTGVKTYFQRIKRLHLLAAQPDAVISKNIKSSKVARIYGCHMNIQLKDAGERYLKEWLLTTLDFDEHGNKVTVIDKIYSERILEELIAYNRDGNFDAVSALFMCMFQVQEEVIGKTFSDGAQNKNAKKLVEMMDRMHKKN
jgi:hypothetical protein